MGNKRRFLLISGGDSQAVKYNGNIELCKKLNVYESIKGFVDKRDKVTVLNCYIIKPLVVYINIDTTFRFLSKKDQGGY